MLDLIIKSETEGLDTADEAIALAAFYITSGLVHSTGSIGRFVDAVAETFPAELDEALS